MSDVFVLDGTTLDLVATDALPTRCGEHFGRGPSTLTIERRGIQPPPEASDPWMGKTLTWSNGGVVYFAGVIRSRSLREPTASSPWIIAYQAIGLSDLMDRFPLTDPTTGLDMTPFNCSIEDTINYRAANAGRTIGEILTACLTSLDNGANLVAYGIGGLTGPTGGAYVLPATTIADLAALSIIPPRAMYVTGEKFGDALQGLLQSLAPNVRMWVDPATSYIRFRDLTTFGAAVQTLTMGVDPIEPTEISRDVADCWQRVMIRGAPIAVMGVFKKSNASLLELFPWGANTTNALAKAAWSPSDFTGTSMTQDVGTCTNPSTTTVTVTSSNAALTWPSNYWDQTGTGAKGIVNLMDVINPGITSIWTSPIVSNTALTAGGTSTLTLAAPLPVLTYGKYTITGLASGASLVWRHYQIADSTLWARVVPCSTYPQPFVSSNQSSALISTPMGAIFYPASGPPYNMFPLPFVVDQLGNVIFAAPTYIVAGNAAPADVWAAIPINTGPNQVFSPVNTGGPPATTPAFAGDSHTIEGLTDTLVVTMSEWRDPGQLAQVQALADDWLLSVKDGAREGSILYHGFYPLALKLGLCLNVAGVLDDGVTADTTGWESAHLPVVGWEVEFSQGADDYITTIECSSRRGHLSAEMFLKPERSTRAFGLAAGSDAVQIGGTVASQHAYGDLDAKNDARANAAEPSAESIKAGLAERGAPSATDHTGNMDRKEGTAAGSGAGNNVVGNAAGQNTNAGMGAMQTSIGNAQEGMGNQQEQLGNPQEKLMGNPQDAIE